MPTHPVLVKKTRCVSFMVEAVSAQRGLNFAAIQGREIFLTISTTSVCAFKGKYSCLF
jgi:hypothetical protein